MAKDMTTKAGTWLFLLGVLIAVILGIVFPASGSIAALLAVIGIIVGLLNITAAETKEFLIASIALIVAAGSMKLLPLIGPAVGNILDYFIALVAPAAVIVAIIAVWKLAKTK
jgi:hypothetical protein